MAKLQVFWQRFVHYSSSLKWAVTIILLLTLAMVVATFIESIYDTPTALYWVYRAWYFKAILGALAVNLIMVMVSRWPWRKHHWPFILAHIGILLILAGSWITQRFGIDGSMRVTEGESSNQVELDELILTVAEDTHYESHRIPWQPPGVSFSPIRFEKFGFEIDQFLTHSDPKFKFVPRPADDPPATRGPHLAVKIQIKGGPDSPMQISQDYWLWSGDPGWSAVQAGPAWLVLDVAGPSGSKEFTKKPEFVVEVTRSPKGAPQVRYRAQNSEGKITRGEMLPEKPVQPGWKMGVQFTLQELIPDAVSFVDYLPAKIQYGREAPPSAIRVKTLAEPSHTMWLGLGDRAALQQGDRQINMSYFPRRIVLPFSVKLDRFILEHYEGTMDPSQYASDVQVLASADSGVGQPFHISMNEPLKWGGFTFYQSSYEPAEPRPVTSIFSVNQDPGRAMKYWGSLILVLGTIWLFFMKLRQGRKAKVAAAAASRQSVSTSDESEGKSV